MNPVHILLAEDNEADVDLTLENLAESKLRPTMHVIRDGVQNRYVQKPIDADAFELVVKEIEAFWLSVVKLPKSRFQ